MKITYCKDCPFSIDRELGRDRLVCSFTSTVVKTHWQVTTDCRDVVAQHQNRGGGR